MDTAFDKLCMKVSFETESDRETIELGRKLGSLLTKGDVVALIGDLGGGKTCFTKGVALGLDVDKETVVTSPSFTLVNVYEGHLPLYHMDGYRLEGVQEFIDAGLEEYFYKDGVAVLEWADKCLQLLPPWHLKVRFEILSPVSRKITFEGTHPRSEDILIRLVEEN